MPISPSSTRMPRQDVMVSSSPSRRTSAAADRLQGKEGVEDAFIDQIQFSLKIVQVLVQASGDDLFHVHVIQFRADLAQPLLGGVLEPAHRRASDSMHRIFGVNE